VTKLTGLGYGVTDVEDGREAWTSEVYVPNLLVADGNMPLRMRRHSSSGRSERSRNSDLSTLPVIMLTARQGT